MFLGASVSWLESEQAIGIAKMIRVAVRSNFHTWSSSYQCNRAICDYIAALQVSHCSAVGNGSLLFVSAGVTVRSRGPALPGDVFFPVLYAGMFGRFPGLPVPWAIGAGALRFEHSSHE